MAAAKIDPELLLTPDESSALAKAVGEVQKHYNMDVDPKTMAWINLAMVGGAIYGPRVIRIAQKRRKSARVVPIRDNGTITE